MNNLIIISFSILPYNALYLNSAFESILDLSGYVLGKYMPCKSLTRFTMSKEDELKFDKMRQLPKTFVECWNLFKSLHYTNK